LSIHGVGLSIGGASPLDEAHLDRLAVLLDRYQPQSFSEHLAWSSHGEVFLNDLLPVPYHAATLARVCAHVDRVQERLGRRMLLENPATYVEFAASTLRRPSSSRGRAAHRLRAAADVNNVYVSCTNHGRDPMPPSTRCRGGPPAKSIWPASRATSTRPATAAHRQPRRAGGAGGVDLYRHALVRTGPLPTLIERDNDIPAFPVLLAEARQVETLQRAVAKIDNRVPA
jgi:uncharacterized protein (UPF0276 family)